MKLPLITQCVDKHVNKDSWRRALTLLSSDQKMRLKQFFIEYEERLDVGLPNETLLSPSRSSPKMSLKGESKMAETILK